MECCQEVSSKLKSEDPKADVSSIGYEDIGEAAYGSFGRRLVSTTVYTELLGICALLFILEVDSTAQALPHLPLESNEVLRRSNVAKSGAYSNTQ